MSAEKVKAFVARLDPRPLLRRVEWRKVGSRLDPRPLLRRVEWRKVGSRLDPRPVVRRVPWRRIGTSIDPRRLRPYLSLGDDLDARATVVVGGCISSIVLGAVYWISRIGFDNPVIPVVQVVGMAMFVLATPLWLMRFSQGKRVIVEHWSASQPALMLLCIALMAMMGMLAQATDIELAPWVAIPGGVFALLTILLWLRRARIVSTMLYLLGTAWFTVWTAGVVWGSRYKMPLYWETFMLRGNLHHDPFYMTSIANMLETYGIASIGIDGIPVAHYHFGSSWLFAKWAHLIGTDVLSFYSLGYPVIVIPVFVAAIILLAIEIRSALPPESERSLRADYRVWLVFLAATIGLIPTDALDGLAIWNANVLISESYLIAVPVFLLVLGTGIAFWRSGAYRAVATADPDGLAEPSRRQQRAAMAYLLAFLPLSVVVLGFLKLSLMLLLLALVLYVALRLDLWRRWSVGLSLALCVVVGAMTYPVVAVAAQNGGISPFNFMRYDVAEGWQQFFPLINLMWTWVYIAGRFWEDRISSARELKFALRSGSVLDVEVVFLVALLGFLPGEIVSIHGGSAVYFSDVQRWVAIAFIVSRIGIWSRKWRAVRDSRAHRASAGAGWRGIRLSTVLAVFVGAPFAITLALNSIDWPKRVARANIELRTEIATKGGGGLITDPGPLKRGLAKTTYYPLVTALRDIANLPLEERRASALFIPQSYRDYWGMFDSDDRCTFVSLVAPSVSTVAMIDGMPAFGCKVTDQYNMASYTPRTRPQTAADVTALALCRKARGWGLSQVLVLAPDAKGVPRRSRIRCGSG